jgi:hypothetical protein
MSHPTFLILGAQKAGTTWIADMVRQHPEVCMPKKKEIHFFNKKSNYEKGIEWYEEYFRNCSASVRGEATPNYLWTSEDPDEIQESGRVKDIPKVVYESYPELNFIVSLRNPVDRAISAYRTLIRGGYVSPRKNIDEVAHRHGILSMGEYQRHIERWLEYFHKSKFLFILFGKNIKQGRKKTIKRIYNFLGVDDEFTPENIDVRKHPSLGTFYETILHYAPWVRTIAKKIAPNMNRDLIPFKDLLDRRTVSKEERRKLRSYFEGKNQRLGKIINQKVPWNY